MDVHSGFTMIVIMHEKSVSPHLNQVISFITLHYKCVIDVAIAYK